MSRSYRAGQEMTILEETEEVGDGEAAKHQAHGQQGGVGEGPFDLQLVNGHVSVRMVLDVLLDDGVEGVVHRPVQMVVVQDQRVGFEDLQGGGSQRERNEETPSEGVTAAAGGEMK